MRVGGANYQVPREVKRDRQQTLAIRWLVSNSRKKKGKPMADRLAEELVREAPAGLTRAFFSDDGSTAILSTLKTSPGDILYCRPPVRTRANIRGFSPLKTGTRTRSHRLVRGRLRK